MQEIIDYLEKESDRANRIYLEGEEKVLEGDATVDEADDYMYYQGYSDGIAAALNEIRSIATTQYKDYLIFKDTRKGFVSSNRYLVFDVYMSFIGKCDTLDMGSFSTKLFRDLLSVWRKLCKIFSNKWY